MLRKYKMAVFGGAASCRESLGYKKNRDQGQETSGLRHSIFFGVIAMKEEISPTAPKKDFKQWLYPSPGVSKLYPFFQLPVDAITEISGFRSITDKIRFLSNYNLIDSQRRPGQGCAGFSLVFFKQDRAHSEPEAARPLLPQQNVEAESRIGSKRGGPINILKKGITTVIK